MYKSDAQFIMHQSGRDNGKNQTARNVCHAMTTIENKKG
jgi:hypothetical protein